MTAELEKITPTVESMYEAVTVTDIKQPLILLQEPLSSLVQEGVCKAGDMVMAAGTDDPEPAFLIGGPEKHESFTAYVLGRQRFAATIEDGRVVHHPDGKRDPSDSNSWEGWYFDVAIPDVDDTLPARWRLWRTAGRGAAQTINTMLERQFSAGNHDPLAIKVTVGTRTNRAGQKYHVPRIGPGDVDPDNLEVAKELQIRAAALRAARVNENEAPEMSGSQPSFE